MIGAAWTETGREDRKRGKGSRSDLPNGPLRALCYTVAAGAISYRGGTASRVTSPGSEPPPQPATRSPLVAENQITVSSGHQF